MNEALPLRRGDVRDDGKLFWKYKRKGDKFVHHWVTPQKFFENKLYDALNQAKQRSRRQGLPFDLTLEYLKDIYPKDSKCPVLGIEMSFGSMEERNTSPSLDKIVPENGYVKDNVVFISYRANRIKNDATIEELIRVAKFYEGITGERKSPR